MNILDLRNMNLNKALNWCKRIYGSIQPSSSSWVEILIDLHCTGEKKQFTFKYNLS